MNWHSLSEALAQYLCVVVVITLHEFGHAWMANRCGDDTARLQGRITLNPAAHIDPIGTIALPLLGILLSLAGHSVLAAFVIGWGRPVPVNYHNLRNVDRDSLLVAMAGPAMNVVLLVVAMVIVKLSMFGGPALKTVGEAGVMLSWVSMGLFFFNLIPVPPLDGSHILRYVTRMSWETFAHLSHFGFLAVIILIQLPPVKMYLNYCTAWSVLLMQRLLQVG